MLISTCSYIPLEIALSCGIPAKRLFLTEISPGMESYVPRDFCPYARGVLGHLSRLALDGEQAALAIAGSCDAMRRVADTVRIYLRDIKVHYVDVPRTCDEHAVDYYARVLRELRRELCAADESGDLEPLRRAIGVMNRFRKTVGRWFREAGESSEKRPWTRAIESLLEATDLLAGGALLDSARCRESCLCREACLPQASSHGRPRVVAAGTMCLDTTVISAVEEAGFRILTVDSCLGERSISFQIDEDDPDPFRALARGYLQRIVCPRMLDGDRRKTRLDRVLKGATGDGDAPDGVIYFVPKFCDQGYYDYVEIRRHAAGIHLPVLALEGEFGAGKTAQVRTRLLAFREMLEMRRSRTLP